MKTLNCPNDLNLHWCAVNDEVPSLNTNLSSINITATKSTCPKVYNTPPYPICDGMLVICINITQCSDHSYMYLLKRPYLIQVKENESETICPTPSNTSLPTICPTPPLPTTTICPIPPLPTTTICPTPPLLTTTICPTPSNTPLLCFNDNCTYEACKTLANRTCSGSSLAYTTSFPTMLFLVMGILLHMTLIGT